MKKTLILGAKGQLGTDLVKCFDGAIAWDIEDVDVNDIRRTKELLLSESIDVIINTAAYHKVEDCETNPDKAFETNTVAVRNLADISEQLGATFVHISTDYVFDGSKSMPYVESDQPNPLNFYGLSKYAGEIATRNSCSKYYICRVASLFGIAGARGKGGNFIETMISKAKSGETITVVDNIHMSPTSTADVAQFLSAFLKSGAPFGVYHMTNTEYCSWFEFAQAIFEFLNIQPDLRPTSYDRIAGSVKRPLFSALATMKMDPLKIRPMRSWRDALHEYLKTKGHISK